MPKRFHSIAIVFILISACQTEALPPCELSQGGWVCPNEDQGRDTSVRPDTPSSEDLGMKEKDLTDMGMPPAKDMKEDLVAPIPASCADVKATNQPTGEYEILFNGEKIQAHCNNDIDGGGWMLVARSVPGGDSLFGWKQDTGAIDDDTSPFSFDLTGVNFSEVLATDYGMGKRPGGRQFVLTMPDRFFENCSTQSCQTTVSSPTGLCPENVNGQAIFMFRYVGWVNTNADHFWFREVVDDARTGLRSDGWNLFFDDCRAGTLDGQQGLLFIR